MNSDSARWPGLDRPASRFACLGRERKSLLLTLESEDDLALSGAHQFAAALERLPGRSMRNRARPRRARHGTEVKVEQGPLAEGDAAVRCNKANVRVHSGSLNRVSLPSSRCRARIRVSW
jgi:hypothetical protein